MKRIYIILIIGLLAIGWWYFIFNHFESPDLGAKNVLTGVYPNFNLTPGVVNSDVTSDNMDQNICNTGKWSTKSIRPPTNYTNKLKLQQIKEYGYKDTDPTHYEEDHLISLTNGGHPTDPKNLWPEAYPLAKEKDKYEMYVHKQICSGEIILKEGQRRLAKEWYKWYLEAGLNNKLGGILDED